MVDRIFGHAGDEVVIEEFLDGEEASFFALVDGRRPCLWPPHRTIKRHMMAMLDRTPVAWEHIRPRPW